MLLRESLARPRGAVRLEVRRAGKLLEVWNKDNLVLNGSFAVMAALVGGNVTNQSITTMGYGTNGAAPVVTNTTLTSPYYNALTGVTYPVSGEVAFAFALGSSEANGMAIAEFGLLTAAGVLFSRINRSSPLNKASDISLSGTWTLTW